MLKTLTAASLVALTASAIATAPSHAEAREALPNITAIGARHEMPARVLGQAGPAKSGGGALSNHGGPVMTQPVKVVPIFWGTSWSNSAFKSDKVDGLKALYNGYGNSNYAKISQQYSSTSISVSAGTEIIDTSTASSDRLTIGNKVAALLGANLDENALYPVYTDLPRGSAGYCAWHSWGTATVGGVTKVFKFAFFWSLAGDTGCAVASGNTYSATTQALANVSVHELTEAMTDPKLDAWFDSRGYENADKCAWKFNGTQNLGGTSWKLQANWSNSANACVWG